MQMMMVPPQRSSHVPLPDDGGVNQLRLHLWLLFITLLTVLVTTWVCTLGWIPAIIALVIAKHILVAILLMGLGVDRSREDRECVVRNVTCGSSRRC